MSEEKEVKKKKMEYIKSKLPLLKPKKIETKVSEDNNRVDMSLVFAKLKGLSTPFSIQRGKLVIYRELQEIMGLFERDKDFMVLAKKQGK